MTLLDHLKQEQCSRKLNHQTYDWSRNARPEQQLPQGDWKTWLILAGRGFGKTRTGSETIRQLVDQGHIKRIGLIAETDLDGRHIMVEGPSGLLSVYPHRQQPLYCPSTHQVHWPNGACATLYSGEKPDQLRGPQFDFVWIDELAKFKYAQALWDQVQFCLRLGSYPRALITTTPKSIPVIKNLMAHPKTFLTRGSTVDNQKNLPPSFLESLKEAYAHTSLGAQEIEGKIVDDSGPMLWDETLFQMIQIVPDLVTTVIAIDPAVTNHHGSDETGLIVVGKDLNEHGYVLKDLSGRYSPEAWASQALGAFYSYGAQKIVVENNQGGDLVSTVIKSLDPTVPIYPVRALHSKMTRAQPIALLYHQKRVFHGPNLGTLEKQLLTFGHSTKSPDRVDALVWGLTYLFYLNKKKTNPEAWVL